MNALHQNQAIKDYTPADSFSRKKFNLALQNNVVTTRSYQDINEAVYDFQSQATHAEQLVVGEIRLGEFKLPLYIVLEDYAASVITRNDLHLSLTNLASTLSQQTTTSEYPLDCTPKEIYPHVEAALKHYYNLPRLSQNPLIHILNINKLYRASNRSSQAAGRALRELLETTLDTITGSKPSLTLTAREKWRVQHYLHLRYREDIQHQELVLWMGYSQRALLRKRRELILDLAELMIHEAMCH